MPGSNEYSTGEFFDSPELSTKLQTPKTPSFASYLSTSPSTFDPNANRQSVYNRRWANYITNLGKTLDKINVEEARRYFDSLFELDWNNEATSRQLEFATNLARQLLNDLISKFRTGNTEAARSSQLQDEADYKAAGYTKDPTTGKWTKPTVTTPKPFATAFWLNEANQATGNSFKSIEEVRKWLSDNGLHPDGKFGPKSKTKWDELHSTSKPTSESTIPDYLKKPNEELLSIDLSTPWGEGIKLSPELRDMAVKLLTSNIPKFRGKNGYFNESTFLHAIKKDYLTELLNRGKSVNLYNIYDSANNLYFNTDEFKKYKEGAFSLYEDKGFNLGNKYALIKKQGGKMNKFQLGGSVNGSQQEELQKAFMAFLIQDAAAQGVQIQSEQDLQAYAQQLGEEGIQAKYQEFMQKMQGGTMARLGAKLEYYRKLKGVCPDGSQPTYFKLGGFFKKGCNCLSKAQDGKKLNAVLKFKNNRKLIKKKDIQIDENDTIKTSYGPRDLNNKTKFPKWNPKKENYSFEERKRVAEKDEKSGKKVFGVACGAKMKKK